MYELLIGGVLTATILPIFVRQMHEHDDRSTAAVFTVSLTVVARLHARRDGVHAAARAAVRDRFERRGAQPRSSTSSRS